MSTRRKELKRKVLAITNLLETCMKYYEEVGKEITDADENEGMKFVYAYQAVEKMRSVNNALLASM